MNADDHEQTEILRAIWNEMKAMSSHLGARIDALGDRLDARIDETNSRLDVTNQRLDVVIESVRDLEAQRLMLGRYVKGTVHDAITELRERVGRLERALPSSSG